MTNALIALELRKNRLTLIGLGLSFALVPLLSLLVGPRTGLSPASALDSGFLLWTVAGLPLSAVFLGATAGAGLRSPASRDAEAPLPGSAAGRVLRGLAASLLQFLLLVLVTALVSAAVSAGWRSTALGVGEGPLVLAQTVPLRGLLAFVAFDLLAGSFLAAYALGHALAGGLIGLALAVAEGAALALGLQYSLFFPDRVASFMPLALLAALGGLAAKAAAVPPLSARFERARPLGLSRAGAAAFLLAAGMILSWSAEESSLAHLRSSLRLVKIGVDRFVELPFLGEGSPQEAQAALYPAVRDAGALASTVSGGLFWIAPDGRVVSLLPDEGAARFSLVGPHLKFIQAALWDRDGRVLVQRNVYEPSGEKTEFWTGRPAAGPLAPIRVEGGRVVSLARRDGTAGVEVENDFKSYFCAIGDSGLASDCVAKSWEPADVFPPAASVSKDGRTVVGPAPRRRVWRLPGRAMETGADGVRAALIGGKTAYFAETRIGDDEAVAVCLQDGSVRTVWGHPYSGLRAIGGMDLETLPGGTVVYPYAYNWNVVDPDGKFPPLISSKGLFARWPRPGDAVAHTPRLVRRSGGRDWILFEANRLVEMDEKSGAPLNAWPLPVPLHDVVAADDLRILSSGLVLQGESAFHEPGAPFFIGWDGKTRALRAP